MFHDEAALVDRFIQSVVSSSPWGDLTVRPEFNYQRGKTDVVAVSADGWVIAFEAKLSSWRVGLHQAYRNRCFADMSYLLLPEDAARNAFRHLAEFERRKVGLCFLSGDDIQVIRSAEFSEPLQPSLRRKAIDHVESGG